MHKIVYYVPDQIRIWTIRVWSRPNPYTHMVRPYAYGRTTLVWSSTTKSVFRPYVYQMNKDDFEGNIMLEYETSLHILISQVQHACTCENQFLTSKHIYVQVDICSQTEVLSFYYKLNIKLKKGIK